MYLRASYTNSKLQTNLQIAINTMQQGILGISQQDRNWNCSLASEATANVLHTYPMLQQTE